MNEELKLLINLQNLDFKILELERLKNNIPKEIEERKASLDSAEEEYKNKESEQKETQKTIRIKEGALNDEMEHLKKTQVKLNEVKTNKEYSAILSEIDSIKKNKDKFEEEIIMLLDSVELIKKGINEARKKVDAEKVAWEGIVKEKEKELKSLEEEIRKTQLERENIIGKTETKLVQVYQKLSDHKDKLAMAEVKNMSCQGCFIKVLPQKYNELKSGENIIFCSNCQRILYCQE
ncbi:MAG: hypothetical protein A3C43_05490 [Candidatus Schekmanbacteria bacterium RIFCSPHIGHO2_02_FULL_38_11]|uniref:Uncharacterized protein n=1 Tax=Candidatus Schekmanbacteria bacterium RIFCSPLOWO2_12_FULL_38_15 TaxID=1817883 RepID=A0A1F7SM81_9BACT|nr:MAG: hypothetical protein A2043_01165 [Candidatus Schekmanbacteria bacterium GWA2_38_9]OGL50995.1 MAG: hypothetical protein A3H37_10995 [Candidatus Schekmanbacteria bacterium RIFCSPLOWO2_02_FULL_38_14]OGL53844.1 MAG: hypothetical protein A3C43_05490 [Candidatus Schekmanbacteria bacterium RIFCSPHIGHO2_02_FULL_38_11]OGL54876.1 MAG: hypothetical protein A3G31_02015 [Candidatus Schekmanbacteria bacterium RIFCSPLOWO2_12_FULL_38_15]